MRWAGATLVFLTELSLLFALGWWCLVAFDDGAQWPFAIAVPAVVAAFWGWFLSPKARRPVGPVATLVARTLFLATASMIYAAVGAWVPFWLHSAALVLGTVVTTLAPLDLEPPNAARTGE